MKPSRQARRFPTVEDPTVSKLPTAAARRLFKSSQGDEEEGQKRKTQEREGDTPVPMHPLNEGLHARMNGKPIDRHNPKAVLKDRNRECRQDDPESAPGRAKEDVAHQEASNK